MYTIKTTKKDNGKSYWNSTIVEIFKGEEKIGEYIRHYPSFTEQTFCPISYNGKDYALYSSDYTTISLMSLPDCKPIELKPECVKQLSSFCPTEIHVPQFYISHYVQNDEAKSKRYYAIQYNSSEGLEDHEKNNPLYYSRMGFALGCVWGDDSSWKLNLIDLSKVEEGEVWFINNQKEQKWLYEEFSSKLSLKDIECEFDSAVNENTGELGSAFPDCYKQYVEKFVNFYFEMEKDNGDGE